MMERLTGYESIAGHCHNIPLVDTQLVVDRLAEYEDTGLTPERCVELSRELERANKQLKAADECIARCQDACFKSQLEYAKQHKMLREGWEVNMK